MISIDLHDHRCSNCKKMLFRGAIGLGFIEVKCPRCGEVSLIHSFDMLLRSKPNAYVIAYNQKGSIIVESRSASRHLGYSKDDFAKLSIRDISSTNNLSSLNDTSGDGILDAWDKYHDELPQITSHLKKNGERIDVHVRYYPIVSYTDLYTVGIYYIEK